MKGKYLKVEEHWMTEFGGEIENVFLLEDGTFRYTRILGNFDHCCIQSEPITQEKAEEKVGHIIGNRIGHFNRINGPFKHDSSTEY